MASQSRLPSIRRPGGSGSTNGKSRPLSMFEMSADGLRSLGESASNLLSSSDTNTSTKQSKRRSLLPQFSRKGSADTRDVVAAIREDESESADGSSVTDSIQEDRRAMPPPAKPAKQVLKPPAASGSKDSQPSTPLHTTVGLPSDSAHKRNTSSKMPSIPGPRTSSIPGKSGHARTTSSMSMQGYHNRTASTASIAGDRRPTLGTGRPPTSGSIKASGQHSPPRPVSRSTGKSALPPPSRPTFSTYQQHYSPAKSIQPKPAVPIAKGVAPAVAPEEEEEEEVPITFDVAKDQIELLQLSLLHQTSASTLRAYEYSAKHKLSHRHAKLQQAFSTIEEEEREQRRHINLDALETWCVDSQLLVEHLQILNRVVADLHSLTEPGSRFEELATTFEDWIMAAEKSLTGGDQVTSFIEPLSESWRTAHTSLAIKLRSVQQDIAQFPPLPRETQPGNPSSLQLILTTCSKLVDGMLRELDMMTKIQKEVLRRGHAQVDDSIKELLASNEGNATKKTWTPAWHQGT